MYVYICTWEHAFIPYQGNISKVHKNYTIIATHLQQLSLSRM